MATVTVIKCSTAEAIDDVLVGIHELQQRGLLTLHDAAIVTWPRGRKAPSSRQLVPLDIIGPLGGVFWSMLFGLVFFTPLFGLTVGMAVSAVSGVFHDYGIDDTFIRRVRAAVTEGTSALFLMTSETIVDRLADTMKSGKVDIIATNLSKDQERRLREALAG